MTVYFDTSALVKLVLDEPGAAEARDLFGRAGRGFSNALAYPEWIAAIARARGAGRLDASGFEEAVRRGDRLWSLLSVVSLEPVLARAAAASAVAHALRGADAVHLATALALGAAGDVVMATWDGALAQAALREGCPVAPAIASR